MKKKILEIYNPFSFLMTMNIKTDTWNFFKYIYGFCETIATTHNNTEIFKLENI